MIERHNEDSFQNQLLPSKKAFDTAQFVESTSRDFQEIHHSTDKVVPLPTVVEKVHQIQRNGSLRRLCYRCSGNNHIATGCHFKDLLCHGCVKKGFKELKTFQ